MAVNFFPQIKINARYLTENEADGGTKYIAYVRGLDAITPAKDVQVITALDGTPYLQTMTTLLGKPISLDFPKIETEDHDDIMVEIDAYLNSGTAITLNITGGAYGDFTNLSVKPASPPVTFPGEFENGRMLSVSYHFLTT
jgi:hypothetical protein